MPEPSLLAERGQESTDEPGFHYEPGAEPLGVVADVPLKVESCVLVLRMHQKDRAVVLDAEIDFQ